MSRTKVAHKAGSRRSGDYGQPDGASKPYIRPMSDADKRDISAWWRSLTWIQKRRIMEIGSRLPPAILADNMEHARALLTR